MITLEEMKVGMTDKLQVKVIDSFIRRSEILELLGFDNAVSPTGGGSTLSYGYIQKKLPSNTMFRAIGEEYTNSEATVEKKSVDLKIFGGSFKLDRVIKQAEGMYQNMALQLEEKIISSVGTFHNAMINGDSASDDKEFDGLDKFLVGTKNEFRTDEVLDISTLAKLKENAEEFYAELLKLINRTNADALLVNEGVKTKIQTVARILGYKTASEQMFGRTITTIGEGNVRIIDLGNTVVQNADGETVDETPIIGLRDATVGTAQTGLTDIFAVKFDVLDGFHGVTLTGTSGIHSYLPDFTQPGAVKTGEVEMVVCVALKNTNAAGVIRNVKII